MNKTLKIVLIVINLIILALSIDWLSSAGGHEPLIVLIAQFSSILILIFEGKVKSTGIKGISKSKVTVKSKANDETLISVKDVKDDSEINITRD